MNVVVPVRRQNPHTYMSDVPERDDIQEVLKLRLTAGGQGRTG